MSSGHEVGGGGRGRGRNTPDIIYLSDDEPDLPSSDNNAIPRRSTSSSLSLKTPSSTTSGIRRKIGEVIVIGDSDNSDDDDDDGGDEALDSTTPRLDKGKRRAVDAEEADWEWRGGQGNHDRISGPGRGGRRKEDRKRKNLDPLVNLEYSKYNPDDFASQDESDWAIIFQRFIILAVLRWHRCESDYIKRIITRPYLQIPYDRKLDVMRNIGHSFWSAATCSPARFRAELETYPKNRLTSNGKGQRCNLCKRDLPDRLTLYRYHIEGAAYDDDTLAQIPGSSFGEFDWNLGTKCWENITKGHQIYHQMYTVFHDFEAKYIETIEKDSDIWHLLEEAHIDALVQHFWTCMIPAQEHMGEVHVREMTVFEKIVMDFESVDDEFQRQINRIDRKEEAARKRREKDAMVWRRPIRAGSE